MPSLSKPGSGPSSIWTALMDQSVIAGLGNLLTDEICWQAQPIASCEQPGCGRCAQVAHHDEEGVGYGGTARVCAVVAAVAEAGAGRTRPYVPTVRCAAGRKPHRRPHLGLGALGANPHDGPSPG